MSNRIRDLRRIASRAAAHAQHRRRVATLVAWLLLAMPVAMPAGSQTLVASVIAGGGGRSASAGGCLRLDATVAQPLASVASGGNFIVISGFLAGRADRDSIFTYGFEVCS